MGPLEEGSGLLSGSDIAYIYPDKYTALVGRFEEAKLVEGRESRLQKVEIDKGRGNYSLS